MLDDIVARQEADGVRFKNRVIVTCYGVGIAAAVVSLIGAVSNDKFSNSIDLTVALICAALLFLPAVISNYRHKQQRPVALTAIFTVSCLIPLLGLSVWQDIVFAWKSRFGGGAFTETLHHYSSDYYLIFWMAGIYLREFKLIAPSKSMSLSQTDR